MENEEFVKFKENFLNTYYDLEEDEIWRQIKIIIMATGKFDSNEWILEYMPPLIVIKGSNSLTMTGRLRLKPNMPLFISKVFLNGRTR